ncbi:MAG TPA: TIGR02444 family protein [Stellaceae bacterium]|nr:TIGR02444 family protein [Stellaceae bacterium]
MDAPRADAGEAFWRFSLMVYSRPGVAAALLALQDRGGHNVNLVLFALWHAACGRGRLDPGAVQRAAAAMQPVDGAVVQPLRRLRGALKREADPDVAALRRRVLALELAAERRVQTRLAAAAAPSVATAGDRAADAAANLRLVLGADAASPEALVLLRQLAADDGDATRLG